LEPKGSLKPEKLLGVFSQHPPPAGETLAHNYAHLGLWRILSSNGHRTTSIDKKVCPMLAFYRAIKKKFKNFAKAPALFLTFAVVTPKNSPIFSRTKNPCLNTALVIAPDATTLSAFRSSNRW
jgi:hypothetical protein